jgi:hypothetical protein
MIKSKPKEPGQSMVELALTITIIMALLAGTVDLGRAFFTWLAMRDAAQEGAAYGSLYPTNESELRARVKANLNVASIDPSKIDVTIKILPIPPDVYPPPGDPCYGNAIQVDVSYPQFPITMPFLGTIMGNQYFPIHATIIDTILRPACP